MTEHRDPELSGIYRDAEAPRPSQRVDDNILAASQRVAGAMRRSAGTGFARRWGMSVAVAATVLVTSTLTLMVFERQSIFDSIAPEGPRTGRPAKARSPEAKRAGPLEKSPVELQRTVPEPATPSSQSGARLDQAKPRSGDIAGSRERLGTEPASVPEVRRAPEALRKSEGAASAPAAPAPPANLYSRDRAVVDEPAQAQRAPELRQQTQAAPAAAPAADASGLLKSAPAIGGAATAGGIASGLAAPEAKERTPEKWLEDIRKLKTEGKTAEAERELAEFRKRYPDYRLPEELR